MSPSTFGDLSGMDVISFGHPSGNRIVSYCARAVPSSIYVFVCNLVDELSRIGPMFDDIVVEALEDYGEFWGVCFVSNGDNPPATLRRMAIRLPRFMPPWLSWDDAALQVRWMWENLMQYTGEMQVRGHERDLYNTLDACIAANQMGVIAKGLSEDSKQ